MTAPPSNTCTSPVTRTRHHGFSTETRRWVQEVPIVKKTAKWIYYTSDSWDRIEAVVSPGCISREQFETGTRCGADCPVDTRRRAVRKARVHVGALPARGRPVPSRMSGRRDPDSRCPPPARRPGYSSPPARPPKTTCTAGNASEPDRPHRKHHPPRSCAAP